MIKSAYIHIPFCSSICSYCDFPKILYNKCFISKYLESLDREIINRYKNEILDTIYIGGGTPSSLNLEELDYLFKILSKLKRSTTCEITFEANLDSMTKEKLNYLKKVGVNRLSFGIETFNLKHLKFLERIEPNIELINYAKKIGFNNINIDLIYALKNQTIEELDEDINKFLALGINHISTYSLILEEHTKLYNKKIKPIDEDTDYLMYQTICNKLKEKGYLHYEISNFAKKGYESKHNLVYWNNLEYYGFGLGASGYINNIRYTNTKSITNYITGNIDYEKKVLDKNEIMEYEMILGLRKLEGVNISNFYNKYGIKIEEKFNIEKLLEEGKLIKENNYLRIPEDKIYISNDILINFIGEE